MKEVSAKDSPAKDSLYGRTVTLFGSLKTSKKGENELTERQSSFRRRSIQGKAEGKTAAAAAMAAAAASVGSTGHSQARTLSSPNAAPSPPVSHLFSFHFLQARTLVCTKWPPHRSLLTGMPPCYFPLAAAYRLHLLLGPHP